MNSTIKRGLLRGGLVLLAFCLAAQVWAASDDVSAGSKQLPHVSNYVAPQLPPIPDYVKAWPKQVAVEKPDPVLGDKPFREIWAYSKDFARRFKNLPIEGANADLSVGAYALVFRVYKEVIFDGHQEQYRCEYDFYFDNSIRIPLSEKPTWVHKYTYPQGVTESYVRLDPVNESDRQVLHAAKPSPVDVQQLLAIFADGPLDGRFATFGVAYYPDLAPGLAMVRFPAMVNCTALAPKSDTAHFWLSLFGKHPYKGRPGGEARIGTYVRGLQGYFSPGPEPLKEGYFRVPEAFYRAVLPKVTLAKALNLCVNQRHAYTLPNMGSPETRAKVFAACKDMEENGSIYEVLGGRISEGLSERGF